MVQHLVTGQIRGVHTRVEDESNSSIVEPAWPHAGTTDLLNMNKIVQ